VGRRRQDCQDTRQEILIRDLIDVALTADGCDVATRTLNDLYTGTTIPFQRGQSTAARAPPPGSGQLAGVGQLHRFGAIVGVHDASR
jgi:hypothetical protein